MQRNGLHPCSDSSSVSSESGTSYRGKLRLQIYENSGLLTVNVIAAQHLRLADDVLCNSYVKVALMPDEQQRARCKTQIAYGSAQPEYKEKFSFELLDDDSDKRIFISVWHRDAMRKQCDFLGCMSFGIRSICYAEKVIDGWYYLLPGNLGRTKHLLAAPSEDYEDSNQVNMLDEARSDISEGYLDQIIEMAITRRSGAGFGFTMSSTQPVKVCRLEPGGAAESAGLQCGDFVLSVDGLDVSQLDLERVASIIKSASKQIVLEIRRPSGLCNEERLVAPPQLPPLPPRSTRTHPLPPPPPPSRSTISHHQPPRGCSTPNQQLMVQLDDMSISPWEHRQQQPDNNGRPKYFGWSQEQDSKLQQQQKAGEPTRFARRAFANRNEAPSFSPYATMPRVWRGRPRPQSAAAGPTVLGKNYGWLDSDSDKENRIGGSLVSDHNGQVHHGYV